MRFTFSSLATVWTDFEDVFHVGIVLRMCLLLKGLVSSISLAIRQWWSIAIVTTSDGPSLGTSATEENDRLRCHAELALLQCPIRKWSG